MSFEQDTHQKHIEEREQHQKMKENEQFQQELDEIIARLENEQFQQELDDIIERLDQQSQQLPSVDQEPAPYDSATEGEPKQLYSLEKQTQTFDDQSISHHEENTEEQRTQDQNLEKIEKLLQEGQETTKDQKVEHDYLQKMKKNEQFQKDLDMIIERLDQASYKPHLVDKEKISHDSISEGKLIQLNSLELSTQTFHHQLSSHVKENTKEQQTQNQDLKEKITHKKQVTSSQHSLNRVLNLKSSKQGTTRDQKKVNLTNLVKHIEPHHLKMIQRITDQDHLLKHQNRIKQESLEYPQPGLIMTLKYIGREIELSFKRYDKTWWENMGGLSIDNKLWKTLKSGGVESLINEVLRISRKLGWKSHGGESQLKKICDEVEFNINGKSVKEPLKSAEKSYFIEYVTQDSVKSKIEYLLGFVVKSHENSQKSNF